MARHLLHRSLPVTLVLALTAVGVAGQEPAVKAAPIAFAGQSLHAGTFSYVGHKQAGPEERTAVAMEVTSVASSFADRPAWLFVQTEPGRVGRIDTLFVERATLVPLRYLVRHPNGATIDARFRPDSVVGQITFVGEQMPIRVHVAAPVYVVSAALWAALATLPLAPGYTLALRTIDPMEGEVTEHVFRVAGTESVRVPAGEFQAFRVESGPLTLWIESAAPHRVLRERWPDLVLELKTAS